MGSYRPFCTRTAVVWQLQRLYCGRFRVVVAAVAAGAWIAVVVVAAAVATVGSRLLQRLQPRLLHRTTTQTRPLAPPTPHHDGARTWLDWGLLSASSSTRTHAPGMPEPNPPNDATPTPLSRQDPAPTTHAPRCQIPGASARSSSAKWPLTNRVNSDTRQTTTTTN